MAEKSKPVPHIKAGAATGLGRLAKIKAQKKGGK